MKRKIIYFTLFILLFLLNSCFLAEPDYVGTWRYEQIDPTSGNSVRMTLYMEEESFEMILEMDSGSGFVDFMGQRGNLEATDSSMVVTFTALAYSDGENLVWVEDGDPEWESILDDMYLEPVVTVTYSVDGDTLTIDDGENIREYTRI
ncbi:MAG: hypothetical protein JXJ04_02550 [Spirochaetales bacterium]|nr:hypothetical protein [Spirochaetales bacterium]